MQDIELWDYDSVSGDDLLGVAQVDLTTLRIGQGLKAAQAPPHAYCTQDRGWMGLGCGVPPRF